MTEGDPEVALALSYAPADVRPALASLFALDHALGQLSRRITEPALAQLRLAWWRDQLVRQAAGPDPLLAAVARDLIPKGVAGAALAALADGWEWLLGAGDDDDLMRLAQARGGTLFALAAQLAGVTHPAISRAGAGWALVDLARRDEARAARALALAAPLLADTGRGWPRALRPLGALAALARRDAARGLPLERQGAPARVARMLAHRLTGR